MVNEVILMEDVVGLGLEGQVVKVSEGYARNFLLPKKLAAPVTEAARRRLETQKIERVASHGKKLAGAKALAEKIKDASCTISVKTAGEDKMYGSVTTADIASALAQSGIEIDKAMIILDQPIRELGVYETTVKLHPEIQAVLKVWVVEE